MKKLMFAMTAIFVSSSASAAVLADDLRQEALASMAANGFACTATETFVKDSNLIIEDYCWKEKGNVRIERRMLVSYASLSTRPVAPQGKVQQAPAQQSPAQQSPVQQAPAQQAPAQRAKQGPIQQQMEDVYTVYHVSNRLGTCFTNCVMTGQAPTYDDGHN